MSESPQKSHAYYTKVAWIIYYAAAVLLAAILVLFVANDMEEQFFYGMMTLAASYVLRPTPRFFNRKIKDFTGVEPPAEADSAADPDNK